MKNPRNLIVNLKFIGVSALFAMILIACSPEAPAPASAEVNEEAAALPVAKDFTVQRAERKGRAHRLLGNLVRPVQDHHACRR